MDLQTLSGKPVSSENASPPNNFRPYSPQSAAESRLQPDVWRAIRVRTASRHDVEPDASDPAATVEIVSCQATTVTWTYFASIDATSR